MQPASRARRPEMGSARRRASVGSTRHLSRSAKPTQCTKSCSRNLASACCSWSKRPRQSRACSRRRDPQCRAHGEVTIDRFAGEASRRSGGGNPESCVDRTKRRSAKRPMALPAEPTNRGSLDPHRPAALTPHRSETLLRPARHLADGTKAVAKQCIPSITTTWCRPNARVNLLRKLARAGAVRIMEPNRAPATSGSTATVRRRRLIRNSRRGFARQGQGTARRVTLWDCAARCRWQTTQLFETSATLRSRAIMRQSVPAAVEGIGVACRAPLTCRLPAATASASTTRPTARPSIPHRLPVSPARSTTS